MQSRCAISHAVLQSFQSVCGVFSSTNNYRNPRSLRTRDSAYNKDVPGRK
jgi:hypothetical protein